MDILAMSIRYWVAYKLNTDPAWAKVHKCCLMDSFFVADLKFS